MAVQATLFHIPAVPKWSTKKKGDVHTIFWRGHYELVSYREGDEVSRRMAAVFLVQTKLGTYLEIASLFGWTDSNLYIIMRAYRKQGVLGLLKKKTGPKDPKVTPEIHRFIMQADGRTLNDIVHHIQEHHGVQLSDWTVSAVRREKMHQEQLKLLSDEFLDSLLVQELPSNETSCSVQTGECEEVSLRSTTSSFRVESVEEVQTVEKDPGSPSIEPVMEKSVPVVVQEEALDIQPVSSSLIQKEGEQTDHIIESRYAGGFLLLPFLQQIDPVGLFENVQKEYGKSAEWGAQAYGLSPFMTTLIYLLWFRFSSIEDFKFVQPREFGVLLDKMGAPSVKTLRRYFPAVLDGEVTEAWMLQLVRQYVRLDVIQLGTLYFDGHKIPYYGHTDLPKGYLSSRRFPAKLIEQVFANDRSGRPVFLRVHDTAVSFKTAVLGMIEDAQSLWKERGIRAPLVVAFDRELYDTELFAKLDQMGVLFITWRKWDTPVAIEQLTEEIRAPHSPDEEASGEENAIQYRAWRRMITVQGYEVEAISFLSEEKVRKDPDRTPSTLVTNAAKFSESDYPDFTPLEAGELIDTLCHRWRQENYFRYSKLGQRLDYIPGYGTQERQESRTRVNPLIKEWKLEVKRLRKEIDKLNEKIAVRITGRKKKDKSLEEVLEQKNMKQLTQQKEQNEKQIAAIREELSGLSERVPIGQVDQPQMELELEGKRFLDVLRIVMHNAEQMLLDVFKRCYSDPRDVHKVLRAIADQGGVVEKRGDTMIVELTPLHIPAHREAAERLCSELNAMKTIMASNGKKVIFSIGK